MCDCAKQMDEAMKAHNGRIAMAFAVNKYTGQMDYGVIIQTEKLDPKKRKPVPTLMASYCPFCGGKWAD